MSGTYFRLTEGVPATGAVDAGSVELEGGGDPGGVDESPKARHQRIERIDKLFLTKRNLLGNGTIFS